jgi:glycosyltransferase involved in cell wall biosynthesis
MRRLLLITYHYPPRPTIGSVRPRGLKKYLPRFGWECVVITPKLQGLNRSDPLVMETGYVDVVEEWKRRLRFNPEKSLHDQFNLPMSMRPNRFLPHTWMIRHLRSLLEYPDSTKGWIQPACAEVEKLKGHKFDAIVSTSPPISAHLTAFRAKRVLNLPWVADFRDLWTQNLAKRPSLLDPLEYFLEKRTLAAADALVTVSHQWAETLQSRYAQKPIYCVTNGFDPDDFPASPTRLTSRFSITYAGQLYSGRRDPTPLLKVVQELVAEGVFLRNKICLRFYGPVEPWLRKAVDDCGLSDVTEMPGSLPHHEAIERQRESQLLLQLGWFDRRETGQHTGKLFEYLGSGRPILAIGGAFGAMTEVLTQTGAGVHVQTDAELRKYLIAAYREFERDGQVHYHGNKGAINQYSQVEMARQFAELLTNVTTHAKDRQNQQNAAATSPNADNFCSEENARKCSITSFPEAIESDTYLPRPQTSLDAKP